MQSSMVQNPTKSSPPNLGLSAGQKVEYPPELLKEFEGTPGGYAWMSAKNPALLDYMGAEFILIGATPDLGASLSLQRLGRLSSNGKSSHLGTLVSALLKTG